jgi:hypothetical protein
MGTNYIAPMWRMPRNTNKDKLSNYSINFDGSVKNINLPTTWVDDIGLTGAKKLSFSIWVKPDSTSTRMTVTSSPYNTWNDNFGINYLASSTQLWLEQGASTKFLSTSTTLTANEWSHLLFVLDASESSASTKTKCYINGSLVTNESSTIFTSMTNPGNAFYFGRLYYGAGSSNYSWSGNLGQACFFDYALSTDQRTYLYNLNNPMAITGAEPVAYWPLGDNSNPNADAGYPNTSVGADSVFDFDSTSPGDYINIGVPNFLSATSTFTSSLWFNTDDVNSQTTLWMVGSSASQLWGLSKFEDDLIIYGGSSTKYYRKNTLFNINTWYNLIVVYDGSQSNANRYKAYLNGVLLTSPTIYGTIDTTTPTFTTDLNIGRIDYAAASYFNGKISNVQIWDTPLSGPEAETLYNNGQPIMTGAQPQATNLKAWYKLNQHDSYWDLGGNGKWTFNNAATN